MAKWKCEVCGNEFENFHAQGFDNKIYCPLCYFKKENQELKLELSGYRQAILNNKEMLGLKEKNDKLKKQLEEKNKHQIFIDTQNIEERYAEGLYQDYLEEENKKIKKQLTTYQILHRDCKVDNLKNISKIEEMENQQKEFIEYMNKTIEELESDNVDDEEMKGYLIQRINTFKEILSKFKKIIGSDINVGSKGDKE